MCLLGRSPPALSTCQADCTRKALNPSLISLKLYQICQLQDGSLASHYWHRTLPDRIRHKWQCCLFKEEQGLLILVRSKFWSPKCWPGWRRSGRCCLGCCWPGSIGVYGGGLPAGEPGPPGLPGCCCWAGKPCCIEAPPQGKPTAPPGRGALPCF
jgi:hypothetical protein